MIRTERSHLDEGRIRDRRSRGPGEAAARQEAHRRRIPSLPLGWRCESRRNQGCQPQRKLIRDQQDGVGGQGAYHSEYQLLTAREKSCGTFQEWYQFRKSVSAFSIDPPPSRRLSRVVSPRKIDRSSVMKRKPSLAQRRACGCAEPRHLASNARKLSGKGEQRCSLTRPISSQKDHNLTATHGEVDVSCHRDRPAAHRRRSPYSRAGQGRRTVSHRTGTPTDRLPD
jgi:hypothetical protein